MKIRSLSYGAPQDSAFRDDFLSQAMVCKSQPRNRTVCRLRLSSDTYSSSYNVSAEMIGARRKTSTCSRRPAWRAGSRGPAVRAGPSATGCSRRPGDCCVFRLQVCFSCRAEVNSTHVPPRDKCLTKVSDGGASSSKTTKLAVPCLFLGPLGVIDVHSSLLLCCFFLFVCCAVVMR